MPARRRTMPHATRPPRRQDRPGETTPAPGPGGVRRRGHALHVPAAAAQRLHRLGRPHSDRPEPAPQPADPGGPRGLLGPAAPRRRVLRPAELHRVVAPPPRPPPRRQPAPAVAVSRGILARARGKRTAGADHSLSPDGEALGGG